MKDVYLQSREVRQMIATATGTTGIHTFRKWTRSEPPVLRRHFLAGNSRPHFLLSEVRDLIKIRD